jgi:7,8-dihydroneopterin aldolase/epimerase/oxygenase
MTDRIRLAGMVFLGHVGAGDEERADAQEIEVDVELELDLEPAGASDDLAQTVNYSRVFDACREIVEEGTFHLLEAVATSIAVRVLADFGAVDGVTVRVRKPGVPIDGRLDYAGVEIERQRGVV